MAKLLKLRRGTTSQHSSFTGAEGEVTVDTTKDTLVVHDGSTAGGVPLAKEAGNIATATEATNITAVANNSTDETVYPTFVDGVTGTQGIETDSGFTYNPSSGKLTATEFVGNIDAVDGDFDGTLEADAITVGGVALNEYIADTVGAMVTGNTETGITVTYQDSDNTIDFATSGTASEATEVTVSANNSTDETVYPTFVDGATGAQGIETDTGLTYNPSTGLLTAVGLTLSGNLTVNGTTTTVATTNTTVTDNLLELNSGAGSNANDAGILIERGSTGDNAIIAWDESADKFTVGTTTGTASSTGDISITTGTLVANVEGNVTGNVTGNTSGSAGSCTGNAATATTATNVTVADESSDTSCNVLFTTAATGDLAPKSGTNLTFNSSTGDLTATIITDSKGELRTIPQLSKSSKHTIVLADAGKHSINSSGGWEFDTSTAFTAGLAITLINNSGSDQTIEADGVTLYNTADAATGNRTLAGRGMATVICTASNTYYISGAGLS